MAKSLRLSADDRALLSAWVEAKSELTRRARVILSSDAGESVDSVCAETGLSRTAVLNWRKRFRQGGIGALAPKTAVSLTDSDVREFEDWRARGGLREQRATVMLVLARTNDLAKAALESGVSIDLAARWRTQFNKFGISGLRSRANTERPLVRPLSDEERAALLIWEKTDGPLATKAKCLLAAADGELISSIAARLSVSPSSAVYWCRRFVVGGMHTFMPTPMNAASLFSPEQRLELERLARCYHSRTARRAAALLLAGSGNADRGGPTVARSTLKRWIREFKLRGVQGLAGSRGPDTQPVVRQSPTLPLRMRAQLTLRVFSRDTVTLHGMTSSVNHKRIDVVVDGNLDTAPLKGARVTATIAWTASRDDGKRVLLSVQGFVADAAPGSISVTVRSAAFFTEPRTIHEGRSEGDRQVLIGRDLMPVGQERELSPT